MNREFVDEMDLRERSNEVQEALDHLQGQLTDEGTANFLDEIFDEGLSAHDLSGSIMSMSVPAANRFGRASSYAEEQGLDELAR
jgi:hypothetical protein